MFPARPTAPGRMMGRLGPLPAPPLPPNPAEEPLPERNWQSLLGQTLRPNENIDPEMEIKPNRGRTKDRSLEYPEDPKSFRERGV